MTPFRFGWHPPPRGFLSQPWVLWILSDKNNPWILGLVHSPTPSVPRRSTWDMGPQEGTNASQRCWQFLVVTVRDYLLSSLNHEWWMKSLMGILSILRIYSSWLNQKSTTPPNYCFLIWYDKLRNTNIEDFSMAPTWIRNESRICVSTIS